MLPAINLYRNKKVWIQATEFPSSECLFAIFHVADLHTPFECSEAIREVWQICILAIHVC